ncbi:MAG: cobalamin-binding protein, partial [Caldithrix sp.]|nr:cobalamin-binding protein [Caldithrix sp.]
MQNPDKKNPLCNAMDQHADALFNKVNTQVFETFPDIESKYGQEGVQRTREDIRFHLQYLQTAVCMQEKNLFLDYVAWLKMYFTSIKLPPPYYLKTLQMIREAGQTLFAPESANILKEYIDHALQRFDDLPSQANTFLSTDNKLNILAQQYLNTLLRKDRMAAEKLIMQNVENGVSIKDIYLYVFQPAQWEIGRLWQHNEINVAMEHYCTAATQFIMSRLYEYIFSTDKTGKGLVATSVSGELHELGIRMVSDFFEMEGWNTYYLGSNTPINSIIQMITDTHADVLAISSTIPFNVPKVSKLIEAVRKKFAFKDIKIIVGGKPFNTNKQLWEKVNA